MLNSQDERRLRGAIEQARLLADPGAFTRLFGNRAAADIAPHVEFNHAATLVFPEAAQEVRDFLVGSGFDVGPPAPSKVVRARLAERHGVSEENLNVTIVHALPTSGTGGGLEVFIMPRESADEAAPGLVERERRNEEETHTGWLVPNGDLERIRRHCRYLLGMKPDGGGYNPYDDPESGGKSVLYFKTPAEGKTLGARFELTAKGLCADVLDAHLDEPVQVTDEHTALLSILAGHWSARALHVAVDLGIADAFGDETLAPVEVSRRIGCDTAATARLLRFLSRLGALRKLGECYELSEMGKLLREDDPFSDLIRIYGGEFYDAWSDLAAAVRTGSTAFSHRFGSEHFDYFAAAPDSSRTFDRAMQAVTRLVAEELSRCYPFQGGSSVVDVGGGNGTLLRTIVKEHADVTGVVFDRAHVTGAAATGGPGRLRFVAGDFFDEVPAGGETYLLSRVLHDWGDEECDRILRNCRRACDTGTRLLVLERLLPDQTESRSGNDLATPWDLQMLTVTGGRERNRAEYEKLLHGAGFRIDCVASLPVELNLLVAAAT
ncbi:methyltransferase [Amycolatopsis speibonae]|uniref:Methyltransferase n=1 Tax=Amycolatopsis speibonae TaxID=1450224 RepID=A0ABV7P300_9PSEU